MALRMPIDVDARRKPLVFVACLVPFLWLIANGFGLFGGSLGANPIDKITDVTGTWTLRFVLITLAVTPLRRLTGWNAIIRFRRMLGLFAFFYGSMHFLTWSVLDQFFAWQFIVADIAKRPYITVGFLGFVLMIPLAITSTTGWIRRLGGKRWQLLHRVDLRHRGVRRDALPVAGEVGHHPSADLRRDPRGAARHSRVVRVAAEAEAAPPAGATDAAASALRTAPRSSR